MIGVIARMKVKDGSSVAFEAVMASLASEIRAMEPGNLVYQLCKSPAEPGVYVVLELYASAEAFKSHSESAYLSGAGPKLRELLSERPAIETYDAIT
jgi:quinol monooxygenase YgiN